MSIENRFDFIIIGAGPAGLQAGHHLQRAGMRYIILESGDAPGSYFQTFPRHRKLISINKIHTGYDDAEINLRWDWNSLLAEDSDPLLFGQYSKRYFPAADDLLRYMSDYADRHALTIRYGARVDSVRRPGDFELTTEIGETFRARALIVATGVSMPWLPDIPGIELAEPYATVSIDPEEFVNKRVLILGKGNSAFETADHLTEVAAMIHVCSPNPLKMAWSTHFVGHLRAVNNTFLDTYQLKSQNAVLDARIAGIERRDEGYVVTFAYEHAQGEVEELYYDRVIACTGFRFNPEIFAPECRPAMCAMGKLPVQMSNWESENVPDMFFAGTIMQWRDYKKYMSGFIHGFRYNVRTLCRMLQERYGNEVYPVVTSCASADFVIENIVRRVNSSSCLWQQPGFLADVFVQRGGDDIVELREELPVDYIHEKWGAKGDPYIILTLEFGRQKFDNPFNVSRISRDNVEQSAGSNFLHPIVRLCVNGKVLREHHVIEDLAAEWREPEHILPLRSFLYDVMAPTVVS
jgi:thioredoxin reductase